MAQQKWKQKCIKLLSAAAAGLSVKKKQKKLCFGHNAPVLAGYLRSCLVALLGEATRRKRVS